MKAALIDSRDEKEEDSLLQYFKLISGDARSRTKSKEIFSWQILKFSPVLNPKIVC